MIFIDKRINKVYIKGKGYGFFSNENIPRNTILIKEKPSFYIQENEQIYSEVFQLLYNVLTSKDKDLLFKFFKLLPKSLQNYRVDKEKILIEFEKIKKLNIEMYNFLSQNYTLDEIYLYCAKYMCNAFEFNNKPVILLTGSMLNHSCLPNVVFGKKNKMMYFQAIRDIKKNEEILDNYIDITLPQIDRQIYLKNQYGFDCDCTRCREKDNNKLKILDQEAINIEKERYRIFGYSKSKLINDNFIY